MWNGEFWNGLKAWRFKILDFKEKKGYAVKAKLDLYQKNEDNSTNCAKIRMIAPPRNQEFHAISLSQKLMNIKKGKEYRVAFDVKSNIGRDDELFVQIYSAPETGSKLPFTPYYSRKKYFEGDGEWKNIWFDFKSESLKGGKSDMENMAIRFCFGSRMGVYYLDKVKIKEI